MTMPERHAFDLILKHLGRDFPEIAWTTGVAILLFSPISIIGNGLVLASILLDPFKNIRMSPSSGLIFSLALADFLAGVIAGPLLAYWLIYYGIDNSKPFSPNILSFAGTVSVGVSLFSLVALTIDRRIAIITPLQYASKVTKGKIRNITVFTWCYFVIVGTLPIVSDDFSSIFDIFSAAHLVIVSIILVVLNISVVRSVHNQALIIKKTVDLENVAVLQNAFHREKAVTKTICVMVAVFEICIWPFIIISFIANAMRKVTNLYDIKILQWVYFMSKTLLLANSLMNPFLYAWRLQKYRKSFQHFLIRLRKNLSISEAQHQANTSLRLSRTTENHSRSTSLSLPSLAHQESTIGSSTTEQTVCSSAFTNSYRHEHTYNIDSHDGTENTWL